MIKLDQMLAQIFLRFKLVSYVRWCQTNLNRLISDKNVSWNCQRITIYDTLYLDHRYDIFCLQAAYWIFIVFFCSGISNNLIYIFIQRFWWMLCKPSTIKKFCHMKQSNTWRMHWRSSSKKQWIVLEEKKSERIYQSATVFN